MKRLLSQVAVLFAAGALSLAVLPQQAAAQISFEAGDWVFGASGNVQTYYVYTQCDDDADAVSGQPLLCNVPEGSDAARGKNAVHNGLLPASIVFSASTTQNGLDVGATLGLYAGTATNSALETPDLNARQLFITIGNEDLGTFKLGRDYTVFALDPILSDMSLLGAGSMAAASNPLATTLAGIGYGYFYPNPQAQISYTTPSANGFSATVGVFQPLNLRTLGATNTLTGETGAGTPGFEGRLRYDFPTEESAVGGFLSVSGIGQGVQSGGADYTAYGLDVTAQVSAQGFSLTGYYFNASGLGNALLLNDAVTAGGEERASQGGYGQITAAFGQVTLGANYGISVLDQAGDDPDALLNASQRITGGLYYTLTPNVQLIGELNYNSASNHDDGEITNYSGNVGAALVF